MTWDIDDDLPYAASKDGVEATMSHAQQRLWFLHQLAPADTAYTMPWARRLRGPLDPELLRRALEAAHARHDVLRAVFGDRDGAPYQKIVPAGSFQLQSVDLTALPLAERDSALARVIALMSERPFDLTTGPLLRVRLVRFAGDDHALVVVAHHIIADAHSFDVLWSEIATTYNALARGSPLPERTPPLQYSDFAARQRSKLATNLEKHLAYWTKQLTSAPARTDLPYRQDRPRHSTTAPVEVVIDLGPDVAEAVRTLARTTGSSLFMVGLACVRATLVRVLGQSDICIGSPVSNRDRKDVAEAVGLYVNTLVFRTPVDDDPPLAELVRRERATVLAGLTRHDTPFELVVQALGLPRDATNPLFQISYAHQLAEKTETDLGAVRATAVDAGRPAAQFDLEIDTFERGSSLELHVSYKPDMLEGWAIESLAARIATVIREGARTPDRPLSRIPLLVDAERDRIVDTAMSTLTGTAPATTLPAAFAAQVARTPEATAVVLSDERLTYRELETRAQQIAHALRARGIGSEAVVGVAIERSLDQVAAIIGIVTAGAAYVPLDPSLPEARIRQITAAARPRAIVTAGARAPWLSALDLPIVDVSDLPAAGTPVTCEIDPDHLAYVIFTSGSTGLPKGVMVSHRAIANELAVSSTTIAPIGPGDATMALAPFTFDQSVHEMWWPLVTGATLVLVAEHDHRDAARVVEHARAAGVTVMEVVPSLLRALVAESLLAQCPRLRVIAAGGEALPIELVRSVHAVRPDLVLINGYGPTESAVTTSNWRVPRDATAITIGAAWPDVSYHVLDRYLEPLPDGVAGELYIGGVQLARGYASRPDLTAERFVPDPFARAPGGRLYRTGDRVRRRPDGAIEFVARVDDQIKLRGFRIELGEIAAVISSYPSVSAAAVIVATGARGDQLVAYVVSRGELDRAALREHVAARLPEYMVPAAYVVLDALPLTAHGKLDRTALPAPTEVAFARAPAISPRNDVERALAQIWSGVLGGVTVGVRDNFFALGGHSMLATQVMARIRATLGGSLTLANLFASPTIEALATALAAPQTHAQPPAVARERVSPLPLSHGQQRLWLVDRIAPGSSAYHMPSGKRFRGALDIEALRRAFEGVVTRHEVLRTVFPAPGGLPNQEVLAPYHRELPVDDLSGLAQTERLEQLHRISRVDAEAPFDLATGPLIRTRVVRLAPDDHVVLVTIHHIVSDGWSIDVLWREVTALYDAAITGEPAALPALPLQYADIAIEQREALTPEMLRGHLAYWAEQLRDAPEQVALPRPTQGIPPGQRSDEVVIELAPQATAAARSLGQRETTTLFVTLLAAFRAVVARTTGQPDVVIGTPIANRDRPEVENLIGLFVNTLALRAEFEPTATFAEIVRRERDTLLAAHAHQDAPFEMIVDELGVTRRPGKNPVFQLWFVQESVADDRTRLGGEDGEAFPRTLGGAKFDLSVYLNERRGGVELALTFDPGVVDRGVVDGIARRIVAALSLGAASPDVPFASFDLAEPPPGVDPRATIERTEYPDVLRVVEELALAAPETPALRHGERTATRRELWEAAGRIADALARAGLSRGDRVALAGPPSFGLIAAFLGTLRSGACLVPLSSRLTRDNADRLLDVADVRAVLQVGPARPYSRVPSASVEATSAAIRLPASLATATRPADPRIAYIYFTSGTTGAQKGVIGNLIPLAHFSAWQRATFSTIAGPISAQLTELGFDVFLRDTMFALTSGKLMALPPREVADLAPVELLRWLEREGVTAIHTVPSLARAWLAECPADLQLPALRCMFLVGEPLDSTLVDAWRARFRPDTEIINLYGTTETGPAKCWYRVPATASPGIQPVGWPLPETQLLVMRDPRHVAATGEVGELVIRTPFSTLGYLVGAGDGAGDRGSFFANPFRDDPADVLYRTGDLARYRLDGAVEVLGRADDQVKLRGQRVDPSGVAAALRTVRGVADAAVIAIKLSPDDVRLVAYVVRSQPPTSTTELREALRALIPPYMLPSSFVLLDALPKKPNGKLDRAALPAPSWDGADGPVFTAPRNPEEEIIAAIWREVLSLDRVSVRDDFFALGGHSLLAVLVTSRLRAQLGIDLGIQRFFAAPTIEGIAANLAKLREQPRVETPPIVRVPRDHALPLSYAQQRMWFLHRLAPTSPAYNVALQRRVRGTLAPEALRRAFEEVVRRHEVLRAVFPSRDGVPLQEIRAPFSWEMPLDDLAALAPEERASALDAIVLDMTERPFDLATGPLLRTRLVRLADDDHLILLTLHHIVSDGWSMGVLWSEIAELYRAFTTGAPAHLPILDVQYADYAAWQRTHFAGEALAKQLAYWKEKLAGAPNETTLPLKGPRPPVLGSRGSLVGIELGEDLLASVRAFNKKVGATQFVTLLAAFRVVLARTAGQNDLCIGTPIASRNRKEVEPLIGLMLNTLVLRTVVDPNATFTDLVKAERTTTLEAYAHQDAPFEMVVDALEIERSLDRTPLFQISFVHQNMPQGASPIGELVDEPFVADRVTTRFDLSIVSFERDGKVRFELIYNEELFDRWQIEELAARFIHFLRAALQAPDQLVGRIPVIGDEERHRLVAHWNTTPGEVSDATVPALFEAQVARTPDAPALVLGSAQLTYRELDARANRIAHALRAAGVGPEVVAGIALERSFDLVAAILGVSKAGGAWVPLDPHLPAPRLAYMTEVAKPAVILAAEASRAAIAPLGRPSVFVDAPELAALPTTSPARDALRGDHLAYVLFTSGSTGRPKGVMISHRGIVNELVSAQTVRAQLGPGDAFLQLAPYTFDLSVHEVLWPLTVGARLVLIPEGDHRDPRRILQEMRDRQVTIMHPVPTLLRALLAEAALDEATALRVMCSGGEAMPVDVMRSFATRRPDVALINSYGPTETSVTVSQWRADPSASAAAIGTPWIDTQLYILDAFLEPVPLGVAGELYIGGVQVGRGYAAQPGLTAERFVPDPFAAVEGRRMYRTGDRARRWSDGNVEVLGRVDTQVKLRGFRIELAEIEAVLREYPGVRDAAVAVHGHGSDARLAGYVVAASDWSADAARAFLATRLPDYMVPRLFVRLDAMPLTASGKVDRKALPIPDDIDTAREATHQPPRTPLEETLAGIWSELLGVDRIGRHDNFFDLGGHSLLAARLSWEAKVPIGTIFSAPTIAELASAIEAHAVERTTVPPIVATDRSASLPLSYAQQRMWFLHQLAPTSPAYHVSLGQTLHGDLDLEALHGAFAQLAARHEVLRTTFPAPGGTAQQIIHPHPAWQLARIDLSALPPTERASELARLGRTETETPFDLERGPLVRASAIRVAPTEHVIYITFHHIIADGLSIQLLWSELAELYAAAVTGRRAPLPALQLQYADFAVWQRGWLTGDVLASHLEYWTEKLAAAPEETALPTKGPRPPIQTHHGTFQSIRIEADLVAKLHALGRSHGTTLFVTLLAAFRTLLVRYTGQPDICIGAPTASRNQPELEKLLGLFVNTIVLRTPANSDATFTDLLAAERATALEAFAHAEVPFEMIVETLGIARSLARNPVFQVMFQVRYEDSDGPEEWPGLTVAQADRETISTQLDLDVSAVVTGEVIDLQFVYNTDLFDARTITKLANHFRELLSQIVADPERSIGALPLLSAEERRALIDAPNATTRDVPDVPLTALVEERAARTPDAIAVAAEGCSLTYRQLVDRSHQIARHLLSLGVQPEERVGICLERGVDLVTSMLGVLAAGACYLPLDPELPADRLAYMVEDADLRTALVHPALADRAPGVRHVVVDFATGPIAKESTAPPAITVDPRQLAYVLYTSGSTGRPKGVQIQHSSLVNFLVSMLDAPGCSANDTLLAVTTASFDISGLELYLPLVAGGRVYIATRDDARDGQRLHALLDETGATMMQATPATWRVLVEAGWPGRRELVALCGGEALPPDLADAMLERVAALWNVYGPTETTIWSARKRVERGQPIRLGQPLANQQLYVLDPVSLDVQPHDVVGELFIGGDGLARGYMNRPDLTVTRFVPDPFAATPGARMYRTGDLVRRRGDGELEFLGRADHQVKVRGFRIELGEIEAVLADHPSIVEVVVIVREDPGTEPRLVAYVVTLGTLAVDELLAAARERLPDYMVPSAVVVLDELPLSPAGKIDRRALPAPTTEAFARETYVAPRTPQEDALVRIWADLLGIDRIGVDDDFFALGGNSLLAIRVVAAIASAFGVQIPLREIFLRPTIAELVTLVGEQRDRERVAVARPQLGPRNVRRARLLAPQRGTYMIHCDAPSNPMNRNASSMWLDGPLDGDALERALFAMRERHSLLRVRFQEQDGDIWQEVLDASDLVHPLLERVDLTHLTGAARDDAENAFYDRFMNRPFALEDGEVMRAALVALTPTRHRLTLCFHRVVCDPESVRIFVEELYELWKQRTLAPVPVQYIDLADYLHELASSPIGEVQRAYWTEHLAAAPPLELPTIRPRDQVEAARDAKRGFVTFPIDAVHSSVSVELASAIKQLAQKARASMQSTMLAALASHLRRLVPQDELSIVSHLIYRHLPGMERAIGLFSNPLVMRLSVTGAPSFRELIHRAHEEVTNAFEHGEHDVLGTASHRMFRLWFNYLYVASASGDNEEPAPPPGIVATEAPIPGESAFRAAYDLILYVRNRDDGIVLQLVYSEDLFDESAASAFLAGYVDTLARMVSDPDGDA